MFLAVATVALASTHLQDTYSTRKLLERELETSVVIDAKAGPSQSQEHLRKGDIKPSAGLGTVVSQAVAKQAPTSVSTGSTTTTSTHKGFFARLGDALVKVLIGLLVIIPFSIALLWVNEERNAKLESIIRHAKVEAVTVDATETDVGKHWGQLVFLNSGIAKSQEQVADQRFPTVKMDSGCLRMRSVVEAFQWEEHAKSETRRNNVGGGETTTTTYSYTADWSARRINSDSFNQRLGHDNHLKIPDLDPGLRGTSSKTIQYGERYYIPEDLAQQLNDWTSAAGSVGESVEHSGKTFALSGDHYYFPPLQGSSQVGDMRVRFEYVPDGPATLLAVQADNQTHGAGSATFLPYRLVSRGCCGKIDDDMLRESLVQEGKKSAGDLYEDSRTACMCFSVCCNLVQCCFAYLTPPQIFRAWSGHVSKDKCFKNLGMILMLHKWLFRMAGWLLLYLGVYFLFEPIFVSLDIIPFLGKYISGGTRFVIGFTCLIVTAALATLVAGLAYLRFHPVFGLVILSVGGIITAAAVVLLHH